MAYAKVDENNRIVMWSHTKLDGFDTEFDNGDYVNEKCTNGVQDFIIENGKAVFSPLPKEPTQLDMIEAQALYTAMMTDTVL